MNHLDKVEKLMARADVSYDDAKNALEECDWDLLDALIKLESEGKVKDSSFKSYSTKAESAEHEEPRQAIKIQTYYGSSDNSFNRFWNWFCNIMKKSMTNSLVLTRYGNKMMEMPVLIFIILLLAFFWVVIPLMIISLFFNVSYSFEGDDLGKENVNHAMGQATKAAEDIKSEMSKGSDK